MHLDLIVLEHWLIFKILSQSGSPKNLVGGGSEGWAGVRLRKVSGTHTQDRLQARGLCRVEFRRDIGNKQDLGWQLRKGARNFLIALGIGLVARRGIEVAGDVFAQVAGNGV